MWPTIQIQSTEGAHKFSRRILSPLFLLLSTMSITDASKATAAAPAVDQPVAEAAKNVEKKTAAEEPSKEADKVSKKKL